MFANKIVLITGGSSGIGAVTAESFTREGAAVAIVGRNETKLKKVAQRCAGLGGNVLIIKADVSKEDEARTIVKQTIDKYGKLDILVNNAGILRFASILESTALTIYDEIMNTNLRPIVLITNLAAPYLRETKGNVVNVSSIGAKKVLIPGSGAYCMSKAALNVFTKSSAIDFGPFGVRVNAVNPGPVMTDISETVNFPASVIENMQGPEQTTVLGRMSEAVEIADIILFLASDKAKGATGSCYDLDNGMLLK